jgi:hypothetical protein
MINPGQGDIVNGMNLSMSVTAGKIKVKDVYLLGAVIWLGFELFGGCDRVCVYF